MFKRFFRSSRDTVPTADVSALIQAGFEAQRRDDGTFARECYTKVVDLIPNHPDANYLLGTLDMAEGRLENAVNYFNTAIRSDGDRAAFYLSLGKAEGMLGKTARAIAAFEHAKQLDPEDAEPCHHLGETLLADRNVQGAVQAFDDALKRDPNALGSACKLAACLEKLSDPTGAMRTYESVLAKNPAYADALIGLGSLHQSLEQYDQAERWYQQVLDTDPANVDAQMMLGSLAMLRGEPEEAKTILSSVVERFPAHHKSWIVLGAAMHTLEKFEEAERCQRRALEIEPNSKFAMLHLSFALERQGQMSEAESVLHEALAIDPHFAEGWVALAGLNHRLSRVDEAQTAYLRAIEENPSNIQTLGDLAHLLHQTGRIPGAILLLERAIQLKPDQCDLHLNLGIAYSDVGRSTEAEACFRKALELKPQQTEALTTLSNLCYTSHRVEEAESYARKALAIDEQNGFAWANLANALMHQGRHPEAITAHKRAAKLAPQLAQGWSNMLLTLNYFEQSTPEQLLEEHRAYGTQFTPAKGPNTIFKRDRSPNRKLRVGYVSPDFCAHVCTFFSEPTIEKHDRSQVEVLCYYNNAIVDPVTQRFKNHADLWRDIWGISDDEIEARMLADNLDIVVDLAGHTSKNRLPLLARRVAPIQVTWLGYPNGTGLPAMDWRITDQWTDPAPMADAHHVERLMRLKRPFIGYRPNAEAPEVADPPFLKNGYVTFGAYNNFSKVSDYAMSMWAEILNRVEGAHLRLKTHALKDKMVLEIARERLIKHGCHADRIHLSNIIPGHGDHLSSYGALDIALDTFPYHGTTTTCEATWMGVPTVSLAGDRHAARVGVTILRSVGAEDLIANSREEYIEKAVNLANDKARLRSMRSQLRSQMRQSELTDVAGFTRALEAAYREMWIEWLKRA